MRAEVIRDVDGDTILVRLPGRGSTYVRLIGMDTPEDVRPDYPVECGARRAARSMRGMVTGQSAVLVSDPTQDRFDRYGRLLAYVYVRGRNVDLEQVRRGWADVYVYEHHPFRLIRSFRAAQAGAAAEARGVWGICGGDFHSAAGSTGAG